MIRIPNWRVYQHYKDRSPPWVKVHAQLLHNPEWHALTGNEAKFLIELWLVASDTSKCGRIPQDLPALSFRLRRDSKEVVSLVKSLVRKGLLLDDSAPQAAAAPEGEGETETETTSSPAAPKRVAYTEDFDQLWKLSPRGVKSAAFEQYKKALKKEGVTHDGLHYTRAAHVAAASEPQYVKHLDRWLRDERWNDEPATTARKSTALNDGTAGRSYQ